MSPSFDHPAADRARAAPELDSVFIREALRDVLLADEGPPRSFRGASIDSRLVREGDLFVALLGERTHGLEFAGDALARGAAGLLLPAEGADDASTDGRAVFRVADPLAALQRLAVRWREALPALEVVGITGSVGKTTTKLMTAAVLGSRFRTVATEANYNNEIGVPLCLLDLRHDTERSVIEMGMYTTGEIAQLCRWARPSIGVVLNVQPVHLERAGSIEAIETAKRELVEALPADGHAILNADDPRVRAMAGHTAARVWRIGRTREADVRGTDIEGLGARGFALTIEHAGAHRRVRVPAPGPHLLPNVLAAAAVGLANGIELDEVADALGRLAIPLRLAIRELPGDVTLLDDTYNASPSATVAALDVLAELPRRRIALLGDMLELGSESAALHTEVGRHAAETTDVLLTVGDLAAGIASGAELAGHADAHHLGSKAEALTVLRELLRPGDAVLVKGSRALALETVVRALEGRSANAEGDAETPEPRALDEGGAAA